MKVTDKYVFFWGGIYSQWYPAKFVIDGIEYNCCEQYMMTKKALLFGDYKALEEIMRSSDPAIQKLIGRNVKNFDKAKWEGVCRKVVYDANLAKFEQNIDLAIELLKTYPKEIVEASPEDKIWGIGLHVDDTRVLDKTEWLGTNWLGIAIMDVRDFLFKTSLGKKFSIQEQIFYS